MTGFGLAPMKPEGMCFSLEHPEITWVGYLNEFNQWVKSESIPWYLKPFKNTLKKLMLAAWHRALMTNAKNRRKQNEQSNE